MHAFYTYYIVKNMKDMLIEASLDIFRRGFGVCDPVSFRVVTRTSQEGYNF